MMAWEYCKGLYFIIDFSAQNHHREFLSELPIGFWFVLYRATILFNGSFYKLRNTYMGTFIKDIPRFLAIFDLPTLSYCMYNVPFWDYLGPPTYPNMGRHLWTVPNVSCFLVWFFRTFMAIFFMVLHFSIWSKNFLFHYFGSNSECKRKSSFTYRLTRGWCAKFATRHSSKSIWVMKLFFCQNYCPTSGEFWQKNSFITHILFELCLFWYLAKWQILRITL